MTGRLTDLTPMARKYEKAFPASFWDSCVYQGRTYAIPWDIGPCAVFYKRSVFKPFEVDPEAIGTWDDYIAAGKRILKRSGGKTKMMILSAGGLDAMFELLIQQSGGQMFDEQGRIAIRSPQVAQVVDLLRKMRG